MVSVLLILWKQKHSIQDPPVPFQHHPVRVDGDSAEGVAVRWSLNHSFQRQVVHSCVFVLAVATSVGVSSHVTHHAAVGAYDGQELIEVPREASGIWRVGVDGEVTWTKRKHMHTLVINDHVAFDSVSSVALIISYQQLLDLQL